MSSAAWWFLALLFVAVPVAALLFTALWVLKLIHKYRLFSEEDEAMETEETGPEEGPPDA